jgi:HPt (histidine-containing phosphotransfer) domain-containing protein
MLEQLAALGVDIEDGKKRFMNNTALYERMLRKLPENAKELEVASYLHNGEYEKALSNAHTLKGVTGNLSVTPLYQGYSEIVTLLRENNPEQALVTLQQILPIQEEIFSVLKEEYT